jgi:hypothetical protein
LASWHQELNVNAHIEVLYWGNQEFLVHY